MFRNDANLMRPTFGINLMFDRKQLASLDYNFGRIGHMSTFTIFLSVRIIRSILIRTRYVIIRYVIALLIISDAQTLDRTDAVR